MAVQSVDSAAVMTQTDGKGPHVSGGPDVPETRSNQRRSPWAGAALAVLATGLGGCSTDLSSFSNPFSSADPIRSSDYNAFYRRDSKGASVVTAADLVGADGRCAFDPAPVMSGPPDAPAAAAPAQDQPINPGSNRALYFTAGPETGRQGANAQTQNLPSEVSGGPRGIALQMTECEVVRLAGYTDRVEISANERGQRTVTLTYMTGARPGIYRFVGGRLATMDRVAEPEPAKPAKPAKNAKAKQRQQ